MKATKLLILIAVAFTGIAILAQFSFNGRVEASGKNTAIINDDMNGWSTASRIAVQAMKKKYGEPQEKTASMMMWKNNGPWKKTVVYAKEFKHDFPMPHTDVMQQWVDYQVPEEKFTDLAKFDGSVVCNRTNGEISARCDKEEANFLALNLANDIIKGKTDVNSARDSYAKNIQEMVNGGKPDYTQKLQFTPDMTGTTDTDKRSSIITDEDIKKAKDMMQKMEMELKEMGMK
jgi:hypothetical protein